MKQVSSEMVLSVVNLCLENIKVNLEQCEENLCLLGMDSFAFIRIIVALEEEFDCEIPDSKLIIEEMDTVTKIINVLNQLYNELEMLNGKTENI